MQIAFLAAALAAGASPPSPASAAPSAEAQPVAAPAAVEIRVGGLLQGGFDSAPGAADFDAETPGSLRVPHAQLAMTAELPRAHVGFVLMADFAGLFESTVAEPGPVAGEATAAPGAELPKSNGAPLRDAYARYHEDGFEVRVGQFRGPLSREGRDSEAEDLLPVRSVTVQKLAEARALGVALGYDGGPFSLELSVLNGGDEGVVDADDSKDFALRVEGTPLDAGLWRLELGGAFLRTFGPRDDAGRLGWSVDARLEAEAALVQVEVLGLNTVQAKADGGLTDSSWGAAGVVGYTFLRRLQPVVRYGLFQAPTDVPSRHELAVGLNWFLVDDEAQTSVRAGDHPEWHDAKLQLAWSQYRDAEGDQTEGRLMLLMQVAHAPTSVF
jgi:hypothetical protein